MSIIDNTNPKHVLAWEHTYMDRKTRFFCTCHDFKYEVDTPPTMRDAQFAQRVAVEKFNDHVANIGKSDKDIISDAVIVSEQTIKRDFSDVNEITLLKVSTNGKVIYDTNPEESFWRDTKTGKRTEWTPDDGSFAERVLREEMFKYVMPTREYFSKYGNVPPFNKDMTQTTNVDLNIEVDGSRMIDRLRETVAEMQRKYPDINRR